MSLALLIADEYLSLGLLAAAEAAYRRAVQSGGSALAERRLAEIALTRGESELALHHAERAIAQNRAIGSRLLAVRAALDAENIESARAALTEIFQELPTDPNGAADAYVARAELALAERQMDVAAANLKKAIELRPTRVGLWENIAMVGGAAGRLRELCQAAREQAGSATENPAALGLFAEILAATHAAGALPITEQEIEQAYEQALALQPNDSQLRLKFATRLYRSRARDARAHERAVSELSQLATNLPPGKRRLQAALMLAETEEAAVDRFRIGALLDDVVREGPGDGQAFVTLGAMALRRDEPELAMALLARGISRARDLAMAYPLLADILVGERVAAQLEHDLATLISMAVPNVADDARAIATVLGRLIAASGEAVRSDIHEALYTKGHQIKNLLGVAGARARSLTRSVRTLSERNLDSEAMNVELAETAKRLAEWTEQVGGLYTEWATYLRTLKEDHAREDLIAVRALVTDVAAELASAGDGRGATLVFAAKIPDVRGDRAQLREALLNLVGNAWDAQSAAGLSQPVEVVVTTVAQAAGSHARQGGIGAVQIEIRDSGGGIAAADLRRVFRPGFTTKSNGSGFGLSIAERIIVAHRGRLVVESSVGKGTTVRVILPVDAGGWQLIGGAVIAPVQRE